jgi:hypothetical protein
MWVVCMRSTTGVTDWSLETGFLCATVNNLPHVGVAVMYVALCTYWLCLCVVTMQHIRLNDLEYITSFYIHFSHHEGSWLKLWLQLSHVVLFESPTSRSTEKKHTMLVTLQTDSHLPIKYYTRHRQTLKWSTYFSDSRCKQPP